MTDWNRFTKRDLQGQLYFCKDHEAELRQAVEEEFVNIGFAAENIAIEIDSNKRCILISRGKGCKWPHGWEQFWIRLLIPQENPEILRGEDLGQYGWELIRHGNRISHGPYHELSQVWQDLQMILDYKAFKELKKQRQARSRKGNSA